MKLYSNLAVNNIILKPFPFQMELVMEAFLVENPLVLSFDGETAPEIIACEKPLQRGRKKSDGRIDIVALYPDGIIAVIELKNHSIDEDAYNQLGEYLNQRDVLQEILIQTGKIEQEHIDDYKWIGVLVGTENLSRAVEEKIKKEKLNNQFPCIALILNRYKTDNSAQTFITTETFGKITDKDYSQYLFFGQKYGKGKLVFAVINEYVKNHSEETFDDLKKVFSRIRNNTIEKAENVSLLKKERYYFKETITLNDGTDICVSNQWGKNFNETILPELKKLMPKTKIQIV